MELIHSFIQGAEYEFRLVASCNSRKSIQNQKVPCYLVANTMGKPISFVRLLWCSRIAFCLFWLSQICGFIPAQYGAECTGHVNRLSTSIWCLAVLMCPQQPAHVCWNSKSMWWNCVRFDLCLLAMSISWHQSYARRFVSPSCTSACRFNRVFLSAGAFEWMTPTVLSCPKVYYFANSIFELWFSVVPIWAASDEVFRHW